MLRDESILVSGEEFISLGIIQTCTCTFRTSGQDQLLIHVVSEEVANLTE